MVMKKFSVLCVLLVGGVLLMGANGCSSDPNIEGAKLDLRNKDYDRALENVNTALERNPQNAEALDLKGQILQEQAGEVTDPEQHRQIVEQMLQAYNQAVQIDPGLQNDIQQRLDRKSTRLNSSHVKISYAVFCLKKKTEAAAI